MSFPAVFTQADRAPRGRARGASSFESRWIPALLFLHVSILAVAGQEATVGSAETTGRVATPSILQAATVPTANEISAAQLFDEPLIPSRPPTPEDNQALLQAIRTFAHRSVRDDFSALGGFLEAFPGSAWALALESQLGRECYRVGRYSRAIEAWERVWQTGRAIGGEVADSLANRAGSELALMHARLGRMAELRPLIAELDARPARGSNPSAIRGARDGLWSMEHRPDVSFRCGSLALDRICSATDRSKAGSQLIQDSQSTTNGFSAAQVLELSRRLGMKYQVAFRSPGAEVILPAVVHWKVGHYAALIARDGNLLRAEDPTFDSMKVWLSDAALDDEGSGYFLVRAGTLPDGWRGVPAEEADQVWGKGQTGVSDPRCITPYDEKAKVCRDPYADYTTMTSHAPQMATWNVHLMLASHSVEDTPVGYTPPVGPPIYIHAAYSAMNGWPDFGLPYSNVSQEWRLNWVAYVTDDPMNPAGDIQFAVEGGGTLVFTDYNSTNEIFQNLFRNVAKLARTGTNSYEIRYPDGSKKIFGHAGPTVGTRRTIFMTAIVDSAGNAATIQFDQPGRIASITDAIGQRTQFFYDRPLTNEFIHPSVAWVPPFLLTRVVDPFGRTATFDYGSSINARLASITDAIGITSSFRYDYVPGQPDLGMTNLITPYGTTVFKRGSYKGLYRANWVEITHPNGEKERVEYSEGPPNVYSSEPLGIVPKGMPVRNYILWARNTFYWDRQAYAQGYSRSDFTKARIYHWLHGQDYNTASPILESHKNPHEHRTWFSYEGQLNATFVGTSDKPTTIGRTLENGATQLYRFERNSLSKPTKAIDPLGRELTFVYESNEIDLKEVRQTRAGQNELLIRATYNPQHLPLTITDAAGQTTRFSYNERGQVLSVTNPMGHVTAYSYDSNGYLIAADGPLPGTSDTGRFTYDSVGRLRTVSDVDGYTLVFDYDVLDRITRVTYPDGTYESITYNRLDPEVLCDRAGRETRLTHDSVRQLVAVEDPLGRVTTYDWCGCGSLTSLTDPLGRVTSWIRDFQGRVTSRIYPDGSRVQYDYDTATGWLKSIRDEHNQVTIFDYNLDGTFREKRYLNALLPTPGVKLTYDPNYRRVLTMEDGTGLTTFSYHPITGSPTPNAGKLTSIDGPLPSDTITIAYDELGREAAWSMNGQRVQRSWDAAGRMIQLTNVLGAFTYSWEGASRRLLAINYPNGQRTAFSYFLNVKDQLLQQITHFKPNSTLLSRFTYDYNSLQQMIQSTVERAGAGPVQSVFEYDAADQLTNVVATQLGSTVDSHAFVFDAAGNRIEEAGPAGSKRSDYNALNEVVTISNTPPPAITYEWDAEGRLAAFNQGTHRTEISYDGLNRRSRVVERENGSVVSDRRYVWCKLNLWEERDAAGGTTLKRFSSYGIRAENGADIPAGVYLFTLDRLQSVRDMTDVAGNVRGAYDYAPFGQRTRTTGDLEADFGFTGHYLHRPSGLNLAVYRAYDPALGRWLSRDPLGEIDHLNLYVYARNDPVNYADPLGLQTRADGLVKDLSGFKDAKAGMDAYNQAKKAGKAVESVVEKGLKKTVTDKLESKGKDAIKEIVPGDQKEMEKLIQNAEDRKKDSIDPYKNTLTPIYTEAGDVLQGKQSGGSPGAPCNPGPAQAPPAAQEKGLLDTFFEWVSSIGAPAADPSDPKPLSPQQVNPKTQPFIPPRY